MVLEIIIIYTLPQFNSKNQKVSQSEKSSILIYYKTLLYSDENKKIV